jgi:hypothetical protein
MTVSEELVAKGQGPYLISQGKLGERAAVMLAQLLDNQGRMTVSAGRHPVPVS